MTGIVDALYKRILLAAHPVGCIYTSTEATSPAALFGGTWEQLKDRFLLGAGDTYSPGSEAGQSEVTLTVENLPVHTHNMGGYVFNWGVKSGFSSPVHVIGTNVSIGYTEGNGLGTDQNAGNVTKATGGGQAHNNMPPYLAVYMWRRVS